MEMQVTVPVSTHGVVRVPLMGQSASSAVVSESGKPIWSGGKFAPGDGITNGRVLGDFIEFETTSGAFSFELAKSS